MLIPVFYKEGPIVERPNNKQKLKKKKEKEKNGKKQNRSKWATKAQRRKKERKPSGLAWQEMAASRPISTTRGKSIKKGPWELKERGKTKQMGHKGPKKEVRVQWASRPTGVVRGKNKANGSWGPEEIGKSPTGQQAHKCSKK